MSFNNEFMYNGFHGDKSTLSAICARCGFDESKAADYVHTSIPNFNKWLRDNSANPTALKLLAIRAGQMPWPEWEGWEIHKGHLFPPGFTRNGLSPGDIHSVIFLKQLVSEQRKTISRLKNYDHSIARVLNFS
jgi:hypothetical protein